MFLLLLKSLLPEKNIVIGWIAGGLTALIIQGLIYLGAPLTQAQAASISLTVVPLVAHGYDTVLKAISSIKAPTS